MKGIPPATLDLAALRRVRRALVVGMARSGQQAARLLQDLGVAEVVCTDLRADAGAVPGTRSVFGQHDRADFIGADLVVVSPGVPGFMSHLEAASGHGVPVVGELGLAAAILQDPNLPGGPLPLLCVTGTNGKSSTCALTGQLLVQQGRRPFVGGNLGRPLAEAARARLSGDSSEDCAVVEISSYQLERPGPLRPLAAAILNLTPDHLGRHGDMATYAATKLGLFRRMGADSLAVLPAADPWLPLAAVTALRRAPRLLTFGALPGATHDPDHIHFEGTADDGDLALAGFPLPGPHNRDNLAVAMLLAMTLGLRRDAVDVAALRPLPHRMERVHEAQGRVYINASKATNVDAARVDIAGAPLGAVVLLGGAGKDGADYTPLIDALNERRARAICFGASGPEIAAALSGHLPEGHLQQAPTLAGALDRARQDTPDGGSILLCPACASFDEFNDFEHRGRVFAALARGQTVAPGEDPA